jgi:tetratricopeptide (TPR) repeat protein
MTKELEIKIQNLFKKKNFQEITDLYLENKKDFESNLILLESLCLSFFNLNKQNEAKIFAEKIVLKKPEHLGAHHIIARSLLGKNLDDSIKCYKKLIQLSKYSLNYTSEYIGLLFSLGVYDEIINVTKKLIDLNPEDINLKINLVKIYIANNDFDEAILILKSILKLKILPVKKNEVLNILGTAYHNNGNYELAKKCYEECLQFDDRNIQVYINFAILEQEYGFFEKAKKILDKSNKVKKNAESYRIISLGKKFKSEEDLDIIGMQALDSSASLNMSDKISLSFALGKAFEDMEKYSVSADYYLRGNTLRRSVFQNYDFNKELKILNDMSQIFDHNFYKTFNNTSNLGENIIFVVGMPRSGTSLLEQILSSHNNIFGAGELNYFGQSIDAVFNTFDFDNYKNKILKLDKKQINEIGKYYLNKISLKNLNIDKKKYILDKNPINFKHIPLIFTSLPNSKIIHIKRNQNDNCLSIYKNFFHQNVMPWSYSEDELKKYYETYLKFMSNVKKNIERFVYEIEYEKLISNTEDEVRKLLNYLSLDWDQKCLEFYNNKRSVRTASVGQVRQKIYQTSKNKWEYFKPYFKNLFT